MSAQIFLTTDEFLQILFSELPDGVYPEDYANDTVTPQNNSASSAEFRAICTMLANLSTNLESIYDDKFISTVSSEGLTEWESELFSTAQDSTLLFSLRQENLLSKLRATGGISLTAITSIVSGILGDIPFDILPYSGQASGGWVLGQSLLGASTWLAELDPINGARNDAGFTPLSCSLNYAADGLTAAQLAAIQRTAYLYEIRIYGNASSQVLTLLDQRLTQLEPASASHVISNNQVEGPSNIGEYLVDYPEYSVLHI